jgi:hypothetical protein
MQFKSEHETKKTPFTKSKRSTKKNKITFKEYANYLDISLEELEQYR